MQDIEEQIPDLKPIALIQPAIRGDVAGAGDPERAAGCLKTFQQKQVGPVRPLDRHAKDLLQLRRAARVIDVAVREPDLFNRDAGLADRLADPRQVAARVDDHRAFGGVAPEQRAVLCKGRDGHNGGAGLGHGGHGTKAGGRSWREPLRLSPRLK